MAVALVILLLLPLAVESGQCVASCQGRLVPIAAAPNAHICCRQLRVGGYITDWGTCIPCHDDSSILLPYTDSDDEWLVNGGSGDDCSAGYSGACHELASCQMVAGGLRCVCNPGYSGNGLQCTDINECEMGTDTCDKRLYLSAIKGQLVLRTRGACTNTGGNFLCSCREGFRLDGSKCIDVDECVEGGSRCLAEAVCQNLAGTHHCYCPEGQEGDGVNCCLSSSLVQQLSNHRGVRGKRRRKGMKKRRKLRRVGSRSSHSHTSDTSSSQTGSKSSPSDPRFSLNATPRLSRGCERYLMRQYNTRNTPCH